MEKKNVFVLTCRNVNILLIVVPVEKYLAIEALNWYTHKR